MSKIGWLTPDTPASTFICRRLLIPAGTDFLAIVSGCLLELTKARNFERYGDLTPEETAEYFQTMYDEFCLKPRCKMVGEIFIWPGDNVYPAGYGAADVGDILNCNGEEITQSLYPELYAILGTTYGTAASGKFKLPALANRIVKHRDYPNDNVGDTGGEQTHTLTIGEMPNHSHAIGVAGTVPVAPGAVPVPSFGPNAVGYTGGDGAHNNMQPYIVMRYLIQAR